MSGVWLVTYDHKHGTDVYVCANEKAADEVGLGFVREYRKDLDDEYENLTDAELLEQWGEATGFEEFITIEPKDVIGV